MSLIEILQSGGEALLEYLSAHVLTCLVPAFFIAGAIAVFVSQGSVLKYFGASARKVVAYSVASVSGAILAVCSCTILPLFAGIHKRGAGLGPAVAFLYSGPAINILAVIYSARLLGFDLGMARAGGAIVFSVVIGLIMALIWRREESEKVNNPGELALPVEEERDRPQIVTFWYFAVLVGILVFGAAQEWLITGVLLVILGLILYIWFKREELGYWMYQTWDLFKKIFPILIAGVFVAGIIKAIVPQGVVEQWLGGNGVRATFIASIFGALMYFSTLTEVPIIRALMDLGMGKGPALTLLLAGPALSLPNMIVIARIMGIKKTGVYVLLVVIMATITGLIFGNLILSEV
ncbi:MAG: permease [candidate division Zixibacteria bacterium]|nr:permease [candidate division Zixibacteria bacterium]